MYVTFTRFKFKLVKENIWLFLTKQLTFQNWLYDLM